MASFREIVTTLAFNSDLTTRDIVQVANLLADPESVDLRTHEARVAFARTRPEVVLYMANTQKISAIKALREAARGAEFIHPPYANGEVREVMGLKDAKDAVEAL
jgi:ribosomal protein L7/L12